MAYPYLARQRYLKKTSPLVARIPLFPKETACPFKGGSVKRVERSSDDVVHVAIQEWEKQLLGSLTMKEYELYTEKLLQYVELLDESIEHMQAMLQHH